MNRLLVWSGMIGGAFIGLGLIVGALVIRAYEHYTGTCPPTGECPPVGFAVSRTAFTLIFVGALFLILTVGLAVSPRLHVPQRKAKNQKTGVP